MCLSTLNDMTWGVYLTNWTFCSIPYTRLTSSKCKPLLNNPFAWACCKCVANMEISKDQISFEIKRLVQEHNKTGKQVPLREPDLMIVMTGGSMAYTRPDGVKVSAAKQISWRMPVPLSSRLARSVRISSGFSARFSKLTSLVLKDSCIRRCQGRKVSLIRSENNR